MNFQQAFALHREGRTDEAAQAYHQVLLTDPSHLDTLICLGTLRLGQGRARDAESLLQQAVTLSPDSPAALGNLAAALQAQGRHDEAAGYYESALAERPDMLDARFGLAACLQAGGRTDAAIACYEEILAEDPAHPEANYGLATLLARVGRTDEAKQKYRAALAADPDFAEASCGLGKLLASGGSTGEAIDCFLQALDVDPDYIEARVGLGSALSRLERDDEAMAAYQAVLASEPNNISAHNGVGILLDRKHRPTEAIEHYRIVLASDPDHIDAMGGLANALKNVGQHDEALALARRLLVLRPDLAPAASLLGTILAEMGSLDEAMIQHRRAVTIQPARPELAYYSVQTAKVRPGDAALQALKDAQPRAASFSAHEQCLLQFGLAKAYDDIGERDLGFDHLLQGNAIKRSQIDYDEAATLGALDRLRQVFTAERLAACRDQGDPSTVPVFIVGMPRSGTTLVEQTLASHRSVFGAGERPELSRAVVRLNAERHGSVAAPDAWTLTGEQLRRLGADYVADLRPLAPDALRITDKMPSNFVFVGLIRLILPNARIIHTVRDPVDTCLSCFSKLFAGEQGFSYDLAELGRYYRAYQRLMAYWREVLPAGAMIEVPYEAMVEDFATEARRLLDYCGLDWDPACLEFYKTSRPVHTASMVQVRQPIYRSSVGRWRPDAALLKPLLDALEGW